MENKRINGNDLIALGYKENHAMGVALKINKKRLGLTKEEMLQKFKDVLETPESFLEDPTFEPLANILLNIEKIDEEFLSVICKNVKNTKITVLADHQTSSVTGKHGTGAVDVIEAIIKE